MRFSLSTGGASWRARVSVDNGLVISFRLSPMKVPSIRACSAQSVMNS